jgi:PAS domain S-box-containing protein
MVYRLANVYSPLFAAVGLFMFGLAGVALRHRSKRVAWPLAGFLIGVGIWSLADAIRLGAPDRTHVLFWNKVAYVGIVMVPPTFTVIVLSVTNRERWLKRRYILGLCSVSAVTLAVVLTNPWHELWRVGEVITPGSSPPVLEEHRGSLWYAWAVYVYGLAGVMFYLLGREFLQWEHNRTYRNQIGILLLAFVIVALTTLLFILDVLPFDLSPLGFAAMGLLFTVAITRFRFLDISPIARDVVLDSMDSGVLVLDPEDRIIDANEQARRILGTDTEVQGDVATDVLPEGVRIDDRTRDPEETANTVTVETDGGRSHYDIDVSPITDSLGTYLGDVVILTDVTDQIDREERLRRRTAQLERRNERLDQFASVVSHDLRNPLQVAAGSLELSRELDDESQLDRAERAIDRMESIVDDLLTLSRIGNEIGETGPVDLRAVAVEARHHVAAGDSTIDIAEDLPTVEADHDALLHVFENLFRNAIDHNDDPVTVTVGPLGDRGFYIEDDGTGIPERERDEVFDHGFSTDDTGTGFGLSIVRDVIQAHDWSVRATEGERGGARFEVQTVT